MINYYDDTKITDKILKMARKVKITYEKVDSIPQKIMTNMKQEYWEINLLYKGRTIEAIYVMPYGLSESPRIEYVLNSLFANAAIYDKYQKRIFDFIFDFPKIAENFKSAQDLLDSTEQLSIELHELFRDEYELYKSEFVKINTYDRVF